MKVERVWAALKNNWGSKLATIEEDATDAQIDQALNEVCQYTALRLSRNIFNASDDYNILSIRGVLV